MKTFLLIFQMFVALALIGLILMQNSKGGLGSSFGGTLEHYRTKRGAERVVFTGTILLVVIFLVISVINLIIR